MKSENENHSKYIPCLDSIALMGKEKPISIDSDIVPGDHIKDVRNLTSFQEVHIVAKNTFNANSSENIEQLKKFSNFRIGYLVFSQREISIVIMTDTMCENPNLKKEIYHLLRTSFLEHGLLNMIVQTDCYFEKQSFYVYRPLLLRPDKTYGGLEIYNSEDVVANPEIILNSLKRFNNYPIRISIFHRNPTAMTIQSQYPWRRLICQDVLEYSHNISGIDGCTLGQLSKSLEFKAELITSRWKGKFRFGHIFDNGSSVGALSDIIDRKADVAMNGIFWKINIWTTI
ncbi:hypothetical protein WA026_020580 [Henosepilachna vigintioctopunctata]|uniref:Uncharacterized protein n=1 Tax=Henosepilachna vigintioctopunctata TaxID=420089 RepID=A0AAW1UVI4_9CUCU